MVLIFFPLLTLELFRQLANKAFQMFLGLDRALRAVLLGYCLAF